MRLVVGITGASGAVYGVRLLEVLREAKVETHLVVSRWARETISRELGLAVEWVHDLASVTYAADDLGAAISSGSFLHDGMAVAPCSMKTLSAIANGYTDELIARAADVTLKEGRTLVLVPRETPFNAIHLENMLKLARLGVCILPPVPAFYNRPQTISQLVDHTVARVLDRLGVPHSLGTRWQGL